MAMKAMAMNGVISMAEIIINDGINGMKIGENVSIV